MTAVPTPHLFTVAEYAQLGEVESGHTELQEGRLLTSPSPTLKHNIASGRLLLQLTPQLPNDLEVIQDIDIDLELAAANQPGFSRRPDLVVTRKDAVERVDAEGGSLKASEVLVVVEIVSPSSRRTDHVIKRGEYADAGIPHYWIIDLDTPVSLIACHLAGDFGYQDASAVTGEFVTSEPVPIKLGVDQLR